MSDARQPERPIRLACWSGPRNISTAMMRSWASRPDGAVTDEPLYAHYLTTLAPAKREEHPGWADVLESQPTDWREVVAALTGPVPGGQPIWYQKHMAHHLTDQMETGWLSELRHVLLVREPADMITSFIKVMPNPTPEDLGLPQQVRLLKTIERETGTRPIVLDSREILINPRRGLTRMCEHVGVPFDEAMLTWPPGPRPEDGVWAPHWYASVERSTGFAPYTPKNEPVPDRLAGVLADCEELYQELVSA
ncbi:MAG: hypothetical protein ACI89L_001742 [Phycisphaerales bacterium]|jgi:hypothetical protein